ncbi:uncharacterized protein B0H18DRAFT_975620 [Fomitopsis serialis]|uniref:uncharacterized protein n=1 Tax=Fomitopsis serialis TaxID=139415 RepID=UPI0020082A56|nr:uncharacterized protein B0H18DRAFT_975620 [Neoantrodia serialis]KAH9935380.1 hypothetical protein B0H18DRAFT_975620 [Neoantrodia serialis]
MRRVRSLRLVRLCIANQKDHHVDNDLFYAPMQWPEVMDLHIEHSYVSVATLVHALPAVKAVHFEYRADIKDLAERYPDLWSTMETACWTYLDQVYGTEMDLTRWRITCRVRWLILDSESVHTHKFVRQTLSILQRTWPVALSLYASPDILGVAFWREFVRSAPRIRYLDLTLAHCTGIQFSALSQLPLVALRLSLIPWDGDRHDNYGPYDMTDKGPATVHSRWSEYCGEHTLLEIVSVGEGMRMFDADLLRYQFRGPALWWRVIPNDEPSSVNVGRKKEDVGKNVSFGSSSRDINDEESDRQVDINPELARDLGPNASRRMTPISQNMGERIRAYMESSKFTATSAFDDELFVQLARAVDPGEVVS